MKRGVRFIASFLIGLVLASELAFAVQAQVALAASPAPSPSPSPVSSGPSMIAGVFPDPDPVFKSCERLLGDYLCNDAKVPYYYLKISQNQPLTAEEQQHLSAHRALAAQQGDELSAGQDLKSIRAYGNPRAEEIKADLIPLSMFSVMLSFPEPKTDLGNGFTENLFYLWKDGKPVLNTSESFAYDECRNGNATVLYECLRVRRREIETNLAALYKLYVVLSPDSVSNHLNPPWFPGTDVQPRVLGQVTGDSINAMKTTAQEQGLNPTRTNHVSASQVQYQDGAFDAPDIDSDGIVLFIKKGYGPFASTGEYGAIVDRLVGNYADAFTGDDDPCVGGDGFLESLNIGRAIKIAVCNVVDIFHSLSVELLMGSAYLLAEMVPFPNPPNEANNDSGLGGLLAATVPKELKAKYLTATLQQDYIGKVSGGMINVISTLIIVMFILVALANILQLNLNTYALKKIIPGMVIGYLAAYFGVFAVRGGLEVAQYATGILIGSNNTDQALSSEQGMDIDILVNALGNVENAPGGVSRNAPLRDPGASEPNMNLVIRQAVMNIFIIVAAIMMFIVGFLLLIRAIIFIILTPLAPLAIFSAFVPPLKFIWDKWSKTAVGWMFMNVIITLYIWIAMLFFISTSNTSGGGSGFSGILTGIIGYALAITALFLAIRTPFTFAGEAGMLLNKWNSLGKSAWGSTGGRGLKGLGASAKGNLSAATGLIPGVASGRQWWAHRAHNAKHRQDLWKQGLTQKGANQAYEREEELKEEERRIKADQYKIDEEFRDAVLRDEDKEIAKLKAAGAWKDDKKWQSQWRDQFRNNLRDKQGFTKRYEQNEKDKAALEAKRSSKEGLGMLGRKFAGIKQRDAIYNSRYKEHEANIEVANQTAMRELSRASHGMAHEYQHLSDHSRDAALHAEAAGSLTRHADSSRYTRGGHMGEDGHMHYDDELAAWRRESKSDASTLSGLLENEAKNAAALGALKNYASGKPFKRPDESQEAYNLRLAIWDRDETQWKSFSRQVANNQKMNPSFGSYKNPVFGAELMVRKPFQDTLDENPEAMGNPQLQMDIISERFKAAGNMAAAWKMFGEAGRDKAKNIDAGQAYDAAQMLLDIADSSQQNYGENVTTSEEVGMLTQIRDLSNLLKTDPNNEDAQNSVKELMLNWSNGFKDGGRFPLANRSEFVNRDPFESVLPKQPPGRLGPQADPTTE